MIEAQHQLRAPTSDDEWKTFHDIRRKVLFENRGKSETYNANHPDDAKPGNHPLVLLYNNDVIGVIRVDISNTSAWFRRVAISEDLQRRGHGRALLRLAEDFAQAQGCSEVRSNAAVEAVEFYERCGYERDESAPAPPNSVPVRKSFFRMPRQL